MHNFTYPLFLSDVSGSEVLVIFLFVLIFFGSKSIPNMARTLGRTMREIRNASNDLQNEIKKSGLDIKKDLNLSSIIQKTEEEIRQPMDQVFVDIKETVHYGSANLNEAADNMNETVIQENFEMLESNENSAINPIDQDIDLTESKKSKTDTDGESSNHNG
jgi:sec-independent protein translocase protein TatA